MIKPSRIYLSSNQICYDIIFKQVPKMFLRIIVQGEDRKVSVILWQRTARSLAYRKNWYRQTIDDIPETIKEILEHPFLEVDIGKSDFSNVKNRKIVYSSETDKQINFKV